MLKKLVLIALISLIAISAYAQGGAAGSAEQNISVLSKVWKKLTANPLVFTLILLSLTTIVSTIVALLRKDKCLKSFKSCLVNLELRDNSRFRGRMRVENTGLELLSEKSRVEGKSASYLLPESEYNRMHAIIRYHDRMTEKEKRARDRELEKIYHPRLLVRMQRKVKNITNSIKDSLREAFNVAFGKIKGKVVTQQDQEKYLKQAGETMISYGAETTYDPLIEQLIGTKVLVLAQVSGSDKSYVGVLKDYTKDFVQIMDVDYTYHWQVKMKIPDDISKTDWGLRFQRRQNSLLIESDNPYQIKISDITYSENQPDFKYGANRVIEPYGEVKIDLPEASVKKSVEPFKDLQVVVSIPHDRYKWLTLFFETVRRADVTFPRSGYVHVRHRSEKFTPKLFHLSLLGSSTTGREETQAAILDKQGNLASTIHSYHGYLTNLQKERMELQHVAMTYSRRWAVWSGFEELHERFRGNGGLNGKLNENFIHKKPLRNRLMFWRRRKALISLAILICSQPKFKDANSARLIGLALLSL